jgi:CheY-like chemotaxis protein
MIVDDSAVVRGLVARWMEEEPGLEVVARHANGRMAVDDIARSAPDIVLLDIEMPVMNGLEALAAAGGATRDTRAHGLDAHQTQSRNQLQGFGARRSGLCSQTRYEPRNIDVARFSPRGDPQGQVARPGAHAPRAKSRRNAGGCDR